METWGAVLDRPDPLGVRRSARWIAEHSRDVRIDREAIAAYSEAEIWKSQVQAPGWASEYHYSDSDELTAAYVFVVDTVNFSFWGDPKWHRTYEGQELDGYWALAAALKEAVTADPSFLNSRHLAEIDAAQLERILGGSPTIPLLRERAENLRELGRWVTTRFGGRYLDILRDVHRDAIELIRMVVTELRSFQDEAVYKGIPVSFYKRAQILAADLQGASNGKSWGRLSRMDELTAFADYKLPQILRHHGILRYSPVLAAPVDNKVPLPAGSQQEVEIRGNTVWAVELLSQELQGRGVDLAPYQVDGLLWLASQESGEMRPYHRTRTIYY